MDHETKAFMLPPDLARQFDGGDFLIRFPGWGDVVLDRETGYVEIGRCDAALELQILAHGGRRCELDDST